jgi:hypothetical protein
MTPLKDMCWANGVLVEYVAPYTPQQNGKVERQFPTDLKRANAMLATVKLGPAHKMKLRKKQYNMHQPWPIFQSKMVCHHMRNFLEYHHQ